MKLVLNLVAGILAGLLLEASTDGELTLSAFDYEVSAKVTAEVSAALEQR